jgi:hypothetical protein
MMRMPNALTAALAVSLLTPAVLSAQERPEPHPGSAVVREKGGDSEALIRLLCDEASRPEAGFTTEPNRVTRAETGQSNMASLRLRPWQDTDEVLVTSTWGIAWIPRPASSGGILSMELEVVPPGFVRDGMPVNVTYDMWKAGDLPPERATVQFEANCSTRDPEAPAYRKVPPADRP